MKRGLRSVAILLFLTAAVSAQTVQDKAACRPDAFRLCAPGAIAAAALGDRRAVFACFRQHRRDLSPACDHVLRAHGY